MYYIDQHNIVEVTVHYTNGVEAVVQATGDSKLKVVQSDKLHPELTQEQKDNKAIFALTNALYFFDADKLARALFNKGITAEDINN